MGMLQQVLAVLGRQSLSGADQAVVGQVQNAFCALATGSGAAQAAPDVPARQAEQAFVQAPGTPVVPRDPFLPRPQMRLHVFADEGPRAAPPAAELSQEVALTQPAGPDQLTAAGLGAGFGPLLAVSATRAARANGAAGPYSGGSQPPILVDGEPTGAAPAPPEGALRPALGAPH